MILLEKSSFKKKGLTLFLCLLFSSLWSADPQPSAVAADTQVVRQPSVGGTLPALSPQGSLAEVAVDADTPQGLVDAQVIVDPLALVPQRSIDGTLPALSRQASLASEAGFDNWPRLGLDTVEDFWQDIMLKKNLTTEAQAIIKDNREIIKRLQEEQERLEGSVVEERLGKRQFLRKQRDLLNKELQVKKKSRDEAQKNFDEQKTGLIEGYKAAEKANDEALQKLREEMNKMKEEAGAQRIELENALEGFNLSDSDQESTRSKIKALKMLEFAAKEFNDKIFYHHTDKSEQYIKGFIVEAGFSVPDFTSWKKSSASLTEYEKLVKRTPSGDLIIDEDALAKTDLALSSELEEKRKSLLQASEDLRFQEGSVSSLERQVGFVNADLANLEEPLKKEREEIAKQIEVAKRDLEKARDDLEVLKFFNRYAGTEGRPKLQQGEYSLRVLVGLGKTIDFKEKWVKSDLTKQDVEVLKEELKERQALLNKENEALEKLRKEGADFNQIKLQIENVAAERARLEVLEQRIHMADRGLKLARTAGLVGNVKKLINPYRREIEAALVSAMIAQEVEARQRRLRASEKFNVEEYERLADAQMVRRFGFFGRLADRLGKANVDRAVKFLVGIGGNDPFMIAQAFDPKTGAEWQDDFRKRKLAVLQSLKEDETLSDAQKKLVADGVVGSKTDQDLKSVETQNLLRRIESGLEGEKKQEELAALRTAKKAYDQVAGQLELWRSGVLSMEQIIQRRKRNIEEEIQLLDKRIEEIKVAFKLEGVDVAKFKEWENEVVRLGEARAKLVEDLDPQKKRLERLKTQGEGVFADEMLAEFKAASDRYNKWKSKALPLFGSKGIGFGSQMRRLLEAEEMLAKNQRVMADVQKITNIDIDRLVSPFAIKTPGGQAIQAKQNQSKADKAQDKKMVAEENQKLQEEILNKPDVRARLRIPNYVKTPNDLRRMLFDPVNYEFGVRAKAKRSIDDKIKQDEAFIKGVSKVVSAQKDQDSWEGKSAGWFRWVTRGVRTGSSRARARVASVPLTGWRTLIRGGKAFLRKLGFRGSSFWPTEKQKRSFSDEVKARVDAFVESQKKKTAAALPKVRDDSKKNRDSVDALNRAKKVGLADDNELVEGGMLKRARAAVVPEASIVFSKASVEKPMEVAVAKTNSEKKANKKNELEDDPDDLRKNIQYLEMELKKEQEKTNKAFDEALASQATKPAAETQAKPDQNSPTAAIEQGRGVFRTKASLDSLETTTISKLYVDPYAPVEKALQDFTPQELRVKASQVERPGVGQLQQLQQQALNDGASVARGVNPNVSAGLEQELQRFVNLPLIQNQPGLAEVELARIQLKRDQVQADVQRQKEKTRRAELALQQAQARQAEAEAQQAQAKIIKEERKREEAQARQAQQNLQVPQNNRNVSKKGLSAKNKTLLKP